MVVKKVSMSVSKDHACFKVVDLEVSKETDKSYILLDNTRIKKDKMDIVDTIFLDNVNFLNYFVYCLEDYVETAKRKLINTIENKISGLRASITSLNTIFEQFVFEETDFDENS